MLKPWLQKWELQPGSPMLKDLSACVHSSIKKMCFYHSLSCLEPNFNLTVQILYSERPNSSKREKQRHNSSIFLFKPALRVWTKSQAWTLECSFCTFCCYWRKAWISGLCWVPSLMMIYGGAFPSALLGEVRRVATPAWVSTSELQTMSIRVNAKL